MQYYLLGERAVVMQLPHAGAQSMACQQRLWQVARDLRLQGNCIDVVPGMNNLTAIFDPALQQATTMLENLAQLWENAEALSFPSREITIPVHYGGEYGPDLALVAQHHQLSTSEVVALHSEALYTVYFLGFQPGFAYMGGLPSQLATPRRAEPRTRVPAGSVGIGGQQTGVYPAASPGGWQLIGQTSLTLFDPQNSPPTLLQAGDLVRFTVESLSV